MKQKANSKANEKKEGKIQFIKNDIFSLMDIAKRQLKEEQEQKPLEKANEKDSEYTSDEIFLTFIRLRELLQSIDGRIDSNYVWQFVSKDLDSQLRERKVKR